MGFETENIGNIHQLCFLASVRGLPDTKLLRLQKGVFISALSYCGEELSPDPTLFLPIFTKHRFLSPSAGRRCGGAPLFSMRAD